MIVGAPDKEVKRSIIRDVERRDNVNEFLQYCEK